MKYSSKIGVGILNRELNRMDWNIVDLNRELNGVG